MEPGISVVVEGRMQKPLQEKPGFMVVMQFDELLIKQLGEMSPLWARVTECLCLSFQSAREYLVK